MSQERKRQIRELAWTKKYRWQAYMSSALTDLSAEVREQLTGMFEELYLEVFDPLGIRLYLPHLWSDPGHDAAVPPEEVNIIDRLRIAESDFLVVCADYPSFGAGQEFEIGQAMGLPVIMFHQEKVHVSRMIRGGAGLHVPAGGDAARPSTSVLTYSDGEDLRMKLQSRVAEFLASLPTSGESDKVDVIFGQRLASAMRRKGLTGDLLAAATGISLAFIEYLLSTQESIATIPGRWEMPPVAASFRLAKFVNPGLWVLQKLSRALDVSIGDLVEVRFSAEEAQTRATESRISGQVFQFLRQRDKTHLFEPMMVRVRASGESLAARTGSPEQTATWLGELLTEVESPQSS
jgi:transcriptional regulator with XRE-family HTH domain